MTERRGEEADGKSATRSTIASYSGFIALGVIWGLAFVAIRQADFELSPVNLAIARWLVTAVVFLLLFPFIGRPKSKFERRDIPRLLVVAFANVVGYHVLLNTAETTISAGLSSLLIALGPVFMVLLSAVLLNERAGAKIAFALVLAVIGSFILSIDSFSPSDLSSLAGPLEAVLAALCYASFTVFGKPLVQKYGSAPTTISSGLIGTVMLLPLLSVSFFSQVGSLTLVGWESVLYLSVLSSGFGYLLYFRLVSRSTVSRFSIQLYLIPVVSVVGGWLLLGEGVSIATVAGGALMLAAVAVATKK